MSEMLSPSLWPNFPTSRPNLSDQFTLGAMNAWQQDTSTTELYSPDDYNVWSAKSETNDENEKDSYIKSIWSLNASPSICGTDTNSIGSDGQKQLDETPTNSPSLRRSEVINCNDRWGSVKINQITPWKVIDLDEGEKCLHDPMVWRAKVDGTEVWEEYYMKQHGRRRPQADNSFNGDNVWSLGSDLSQRTTSNWPPSKSTDVSSPTSDIYAQNMFTDNNRSNFSTPNGVRPSMTRNQAQKYLIDMGYSLSDAIGALVNNQMDLPKAINELQSKYRMSTNGHPAPAPPVAAAAATTPLPSLANGLYNTPSLPFNNRPGDSMMNLSRSVAPAPPGNFDMFHSDQTDQMIESSYINMDPYNRFQDHKIQASMSMARDNSFRNPFGNNGLNNRGMPNNCGQYNDIGVLSQGMNRMNLNNVISHNASFSNGNKWPTNGYGSAMHNGNNMTNNTNSNMMLNNTNTSMDLRSPFVSPMSGAGNISGYSRSISKQQFYSHNPTALNWHADASSSMSPNGALNDLNHARLAKNLSCPGIPENIVGIIIRKVLHQHIELVKSICVDSGAMTNFQLQPHIQSIIVHFNSPLEARRCMSIIQNQINVRVELISEDYMHCMTGAN